METAQDVMGAIFNASLVIMIVATMFGAGLMTTLSALGSVLKNVWLIILVLIAALLIRPLVGWGLAEIFALATPVYIAMLLMAACPGAPLGVRFVMSAKGDLTSGAALQVLLAAIGCITFPLVANFMIGAAGLGDDFSIPVGDLIMAVAFLQLVPFAVGIGVRRWTPQHATNWRPTVTKLSTITLLIVVALALLGSFEYMIDMIGSWALLAGVLFPLVMILIGYFVARGVRKTRIATALIEPGSNAGPVFAAVAIAFHNDPPILAACVVFIFLQIVVGMFVSSYLGKERGKPEDAPAEGEPAEGEMSEAVLT
jgi:bile acid:Na+ symporter, BASS family